MAKRKIRKKLTPNQIEYQKQRKRLQAIIRRGEKKGYQFEENLIPGRPKRVTKKQLEKIKGIKAEQLYKKAIYIDYDTGEIKSAEEQRKEVRQEGQKKAQRTKRDRQRKEEIKKQLEQKYYDTLPDYEEPYEPEPYYPTISIIDTIRARLERLERISNDKRIVIDERKRGLIAIFDDTIEQYEDLHAYEEYLRAHEEDISELINEISYESVSEKVEQSFVNLARILNQGSLSLIQAESISRMSEYNMYT